MRGWYELTFDAMKLGSFKEDVSIQVFAGKYYYADDRPQQQRLLGVISLGNRDVKSHTVRAFLHPGENVSVHCYSQYTFRKENRRARGLYQAVEGSRSRSRRMAAKLLSKYLRWIAHECASPGSEKYIRVADEIEGDRGKYLRQQFPEGNGKGKDAGWFEPDLLAYAVQADLGQAPALRDPRKFEGQGNRGALVRNLVGGQWQRSGKGLFDSSLR